MQELVMKGILKNYTIKFNNLETFTKKTLSLQKVILK